MHVIDLDATLPSITGIHISEHGADSEHPGAKKNLLFISFLSSWANPAVLLYGIRLNANNEIKRLFQDVCFP